MNVLNGRKCLNRSGTIYIKSYFNKDIFKMYIEIQLEC